MKKVLVVGGAGYIGSHTVKALLASSYEPIIYDDLSSGHKEAIQNCKLVVGDIDDKKLLSRTIEEEQIEAVLHFAGNVDVALSVEKPKEYISNNCLSGISLISAMLENKVYKLVFSSSAAVYGNQNEIPVTENAIAKPVSPYGLSKLLFENIMKYYEQSALQYISLRYFNAAGADSAGELGCDHKNKTHLITSAISTALGNKDYLSIYGTDYATADGTCIRDYVHVDDLAAAHVGALEYMDRNDSSEIINLGSGVGFSNKEVVEMVKKISGNDFKVLEDERRHGDLEKIIASSEKAKKLFKWQPRYSDLETIVKTSYDWQKAHPNGYRSKLDKSQI